MEEARQHRRRSQRVAEALSPTRTSGPSPLQSPDVRPVTASSRLPYCNICTSLAVAAEPSATRRSHAPRAARLPDRPAGDGPRLTKPPRESLLAENARGRERRRRRLSPPPAPPANVISRASRARDRLRRVSSGRFQDRRAQYPCDWALPAPPVKVRRAHAMNTMQLHPAARHANDDCSMVEIWRGLGHKHERREHPGEVVLVRRSVPHGGDRAPKVVAGGDPAASATKPPQRLRGPARAHLSIAFKSGERQLDEALLGPYAT